MLGLAQALTVMCFTASTCLASFVQREEKPSLAFKVVANGTVDLPALIQLEKHRPPASYSAGKATRTVLSASSSLSAADLSAYSAYAPFIALATILKLSPGFPSGRKRREVANCANRFSNFWNYF